MTNHKLMMAAALAVLAMPISGMPVAGFRPVANRAIKRGRASGKKYAANGKAECARRRRQIERGQLTESNGLVRT